MAKLVCETEVEIKNADGLHMRPAMQFVDLAGEFESDIKVTSAEYSVDGKSIMQMTMLAATQGTRLKIRAEGSDSEQAVKALRELLTGTLPQEPSTKSQRSDSGT